MVNRNLPKIYKESEGAPPPLDESWWEAVLMEEGDRQVRTTQPRPAPQLKETRPAAVRQTGELTRVDWEQAMNIYEQDRAISLQVTGCNRGGLLVTGEGLQGFVPVSHLVDIPVEKTDLDQDDTLQEYIGRSLQVKIIECDQERGRVVFSERAALAKTGSRNQLLSELQPGMCVRGMVTNITDFGVFVDLGGVEGLVHVSELSWGRVRHPSDVVSYGEDVQVHVIHVEPDRSRVALSIKRLYPNPWATAEERYFPGQQVEAVITSIVAFGAFARLEEGLDGLIHVSEMMQDGRPVPPDVLLCEGQTVQVRVLQVDAGRQRLGLSLVID
jgi:small subunit ribosomal protein S1